MHMKSALMNGYVVLIQDVEEALDPSIETILGKQIKEVDGRVLIKFGE
jgi:dynein heavy chain